MRLLHGPQHDRHIIEIVKFAVERQLVGREALLDELQRLGKLPRTRTVIDAVEADLYRRDAATDAELETAAAELIEHADLLEQANRMIKRQRIDERAEA